MKKYIILLFVTFSAVSVSCSDKDNKGNSEAEVPAPPSNKDIVYDETGCNYTSYNGLVMAGYQGWFTAQGDAANTGWRHWEKDGKFELGYTNVDFWPDVSEYAKTYETPFLLPDGEKAHVFSPQDESTVDTHFRWMKEYGLDGVFVQRFLLTVKHEQANATRVFENTLKAANKYDRAICVMYDLSGSKSSDFDILVNDFEKLVKDLDLFNNKTNPNYLRHNKKPLVVIWGVGFNDGRQYTTQDVKELVDKLKGTDNKVSVMLGVPYYWRTLTQDTENNLLLHELIKSVDIIMPWGVGRYSMENYNNVAPDLLRKDVDWCNKNGVDYVPLVFPGFSWGNMHKDPSLYNSIPRHGGEFLWRQIWGAHQLGAKSLYVAMFDEVDEGTAIFKCLRENEVPLNAPDFKFVGIENNIPNDHYLWLTGEAAKWFKGATGYGYELPVR